MGGACQPRALIPGLCVTDEDECELGTHNCQAGFTCQNTKGSFYCQARQRCMEGFLQDPEGNCVGERALGVCGRLVLWVFGGSLQGFRDEGGCSSLCVPPCKGVCWHLVPGCTCKMEALILSCQMVAVTYLVSSVYASVGLDWMNIYHSLKSSQ